MMPFDAPHTGGQLWGVVRRIARMAGKGYTTVVSLAQRTERLVSPKLPFPVRHVLFVCKGNICRSPMGEAYLRKKARQMGLQFIVQSAGLDTTPGRPAHPYAVSEMLKHGMSLANHVTQMLHKDLVDQADLIIVMEVSQRTRLTRLYPRSKPKVFVAGRFARLDSLDIADPFSGTPQDFEVCFRAIRESCDGLLARYAARRQNVGAGILSDVG